MIDDEGILDHRHAPDDIANDHVDREALFGTLPERLQLGENRAGVGRVREGRAGKSRERNRTEYAGRFQEDLRCAQHHGVGSRQ